MRGAPDLEPPGRLAAGLLLTGGRSSRMGFDKATLCIGGVSNAVRVGLLLAEVTVAALEVGPGASDLEAIREEPRFSGPLVALVAGWRALGKRGHTGPVLVLACDMPFVDRPLLELLAGWPGEASVVPVARGRRQPLCARWSAHDLDRATALVASGERAVHSVTWDGKAIELGARQWAHVASERSFGDLNTPGDLDQYGVVAEEGPSRPVLDISSAPPEP